MTTKTSSKKTFKKIMDEYIQSIDEYGISSIFDSASNHKQGELLNFYLNKENRLFINRAKEAISIFLRENGYFNTSSHEISFETIYNPELNPSLTSRKEKMYYLSVVAFLLYVYEKRERRNKTFIEQYSQVIRASTENTYYRGQCVYDWRLLPSVFRELKDNIVFNDGYYNKLLKEYHLDQKFNDTMRKGNNQNAYQKYAFIQHACSFSPFLDFTKSEQIATTFALSNTHLFNVFHNNDSAIFELCFDSEKNVVYKKSDARNLLKYTFSLDVIERKICFGRSYNLKSSNGSTKTISILSIPKLIKMLTPKYWIFDIPTNDRMVYQQGLFLCFYDCLCINGYIAYELIPDLKITKKAIPTSAKQEIIESIYHYRKYDLEHLMNPYQHFNE